MSMALLCPEKDIQMALRRERMRLGDLLIRQNVLTEDQLKKALALQKGSGKKIGEILIDNNLSQRISLCVRFRCSWDLKSFS